MAFLTALPPRGASIYRRTSIDTATLFQRLIQASAHCFQHGQRAPTGADTSDGFVTEVLSDALHKGLVIKAKAAVLAAYPRGLALGPP
jgi:hypothetical protein